MAVSLGFFIFALALPSTGGPSKFVNHAVAALSLFSLASFYWAATAGGDLDQGLALARSLYVIWVVWLVYRGIRLMKEGAPSDG